MYPMALIDKFFCGFFTGVILYFLVFESIANFRTPLIDFEIEFLQRLADDLNSADDTLNKREDFMPHLEKDLDFHHDKLSKEALILRDKISVSCYIMVSSICSKGATAINRTWGKRCNNIRYFISKGSKTCGLPVLYLKNINIKDRYREAVLKIYSIYANESDWTLIATDDTYVIMENIHYLVNKTSPETKTMMGHIADFSMSRTFPRMYSKHSSVLLFSKAAMAQYALKSGKYSCRSKTASLSFYNMLCLKLFGISYAINSRKVLNSVPPELRVYPVTEFKKQLEKFAASFRYVNPKKIFGFEFLVYHLRPYGV